MRVKISSYNVLSPALATLDQFTHQTADDVDPDKRYTKVVEKLDAEIGAKGIITLQEVSQGWADRFRVHFLRKGYYYVGANYSGKHSDYMGVGIAVPMEEYDILQTDVKRLSDTMSYPKKLPLSSFATAYESVSKYFWNVLNPAVVALEYIKGDKLFQSPPDDIYWRARERYNYVVSMQLQAKSPNAKPFWVSTYHMPCLFWVPQVMTLHTAGLVAYVHKLAGGDPVVLTGDYNFKPESGAYQLVTTGILEASHPEFPAPPIYNPEYKYEIPEFKPMRSAYKAFEGEEPEFTNYAWVRQEEKPFVGTLDYLFISEQWNVEDCVSLKNKKAEPGPNQDEPSDHLLIGTTLTLK